MNTVTVNETLATFSRIAIHALWRASWQGAIAVLVIWGMCRAFPKLPASVRCWLWRAALLKFVLTLFWPVGAQVPVAIETANSAPILTARTPDPRVVEAVETANAFALPAHLQTGATSASMPTVPDSPHHILLTYSAALKSTPLANHRVTGAHAPVLLIAVLGIYMLGVTTCIVRLSKASARTRRFLREQCVPLTDPVAIADTKSLAIHFGCEHFRD